MAAKWPIEITVGKSGKMKLPAKVTRLLGISSGAKLSIVVATMDVVEARVVSPSRQQRFAEEPKPKKWGLRPNNASRETRH